ncbi:Nitrate transporter 1.1 [Dendrobium catenatum]|uniref:Nitrate transporter 1.1 n=1 Tax=Dendrobium catenatum TaxID=906689 RepID=A0A2I0WUC6_9ASPA|nr:Nitrate transporter 1.1 [Dendrobium catenatum]
MIQVFVAAFRNHKLKQPDDPNELYEIQSETTQPVGTEFLPHRDLFRSLDKSSNQKNQQPGTETNGSSAASHKWRTPRSSSPCSPYSEAPKALKSFASSFLWCSLSFG